MPSPTNAALLQLPDDFGFLFRWNFRENVGCRYADLLRDGGGREFVVARDEVGGFALTSKPIHDVRSLGLDGVAQRKQSDELVLCGEAEDRGALCGPVSDKG